MFRGCGCGTACTSFAFTTPHCYCKQAELTVLAREKRTEKLAKLDAALSARAEEKGVYGAGADGFDISESPAEFDPDEMTENTPETRQEVRH